MSRVITSHTNPIVKTVKSLHMRKAREESGQFLAEGLKIVTEAIELGHAPKILIYGKDAAEHPLLKKAVETTYDNRGLVLEVNREILEKIARRDNPQAVLAVFEQVFEPLVMLTPHAAKVWVALHKVRDPGNLGTIIRTADAAGCGGVILVGDCCDPYSVEAVRATMGSIFALPIVKATEAEFIAWRERWPGSVVGTLLTAKTDHKSAAYEAPTMILMGNEQAGLTPEMAGLCDVNVKIPMRGRADSLNLSVATGIMIYAAGD